MSRHLTIPTADTQLYTVDNPGSAPPLLFLSGGFGTIHNWNRVIDRLSGRYRAVLFDARARGKSGTSADYSVQGAVNDIGRVIDATELDRPILVAWSYGAPSLSNTRHGIRIRSVGWFSSTVLTRSRCSTSRESSRSGHSFAALPGLCASLPRSAARRICRPIKQRTW